jgi:hypothetical protein
VRDSGRVRSIYAWRVTSIHENHERCLVETVAHDPKQLQHGRERKPLLCEVRSLLAGE